MNQILSFDEEWNGKNKNRNMHKNNRQIDIKKIIIIFSVVLVLFGICAVALAIYSMSGSKEDTSNLSKPTVTIQQNTNTGMLDITIKHDRAISKILYSWNDGDEIEIAGNNRNLINESIEVPEGKNKLKLKVIDIKNVTVSYEKEYTGEEAAKPKIELTQGNGAIKLVATSDENISYITYKWNDGTEERLEVGSTTYEENIPVPTGENTLTVVAVNESGEKTEEQITVQGIIDEKPTVSVTIDSENFIITASDDEGIEKVVISANGGEEETIEVGDTNFEYKIPFIDGYNEIKIMVFNINGLTTYKKATLTK